MRGSIGVSKFVLGNVCPTKYSAGQIQCLTCFLLLVACHAWKVSHRGGADDKVVFLEDESLVRITSDEHVRHMSFSKDASLVIVAADVAVRTKPVLVAPLASPLELKIHGRIQREAATTDVMHLLVRPRAKTRRFCQYAEIHDTNRLKEEVFVHGGLVQWMC